MISEYIFKILFVSSFRDVSLEAPHTKAVCYNENLFGKEFIDCPV